MVAGRTAAATVIEPGFQVATLFSGLDSPTAIGFGTDGRIFVAERDGVIKAWDSATDPTATTVVDLSTQVHAVADRGLLGLAVDPPVSDAPLSLRPLHRGCPAGRHGALLQRQLPALPKWRQGWLSGRRAPVADHGRGQQPDRRRGAGAHRRRLLVPSAAGACGRPPRVRAGRRAVRELGRWRDGELHGLGATQRCRRRDRGAERLWRPARGGRLATEPADDRGRCASRPGPPHEGRPGQGSGAVIRIDPDTGAAMADNPLIRQWHRQRRPSCRLRSRNPFRFTFRPGTNELWVGDVGWNDWEEANRIVDPRDAVVENFRVAVCYEGVARQRRVGQPQCQPVRAALRRRERCRHGAVLDLRPRCPAGPGALPNNGGALSALAFAGCPVSGARSTVPSSRATTSRAASGW